MSDVQEAVAKITAENALIKEFIANRDASIVKAACSGLGTDDKKLIEVLCSRTKTQLERVDEAFRAKHEKTLWEQARKRSIVKTEVGGNYKRILQYALMERDEYLSHIIQEACSGFGTDETLLIDVLAPISNDEIAAAKTHWEAKHDQSLVDRIHSEVSGGLKDLIVGLLTGKRQKTEEIDEGFIQEQVSELYKAGIGKLLGTDDEVFIKIIGTSSPTQVQAIKKKYEEIHGMSLHMAVGKEFRGCVKKILQSLLEPAVDFYCIKMKKATKKMGTDEHTICRILGGNDKKQLAAIGARYAEKYDESLSDMANSELGGHFKEAVLAWIDPLVDPTQGVEQQLLERASDSPEELLELLKQENEHMKQYIATVDAEQVRQACKGLGTDESRIVSILCNRTKKQVEAIDEAFRESYGMTLKAQLEKDMSGDLQTFMVYTQMKTDEFDALQMKKAMAGIGTDEDIMIMMLTTRSNEAIAAARKYYEGCFDESLIDKINSEMSGNFQKLLVTLLRGERDESTEPNVEQAEVQANELHETKDPSATFVEILTSSSRAQVAAISDAYEKMHGKSLVKHVTKTFSGDMEDALLSLLFDPIEIFARGLKNAFHGIGTDKEAVCRILAGNDKATCMAIAERYQAKYDASLVDALKKELRGTFEEGAVAWVSSIDPSGGAEADTETSLEEAAEESEGEDEGDNGEDEDEDEEGEEGEDNDEDVSDDGESEGDGEEETEENKQARKTAKRKAKQRRAKRMKCRLAKAKTEAKKARQRNRMLTKKRNCALRVSKISCGAREQVDFAKNRYENDSIPGLTVWGKFQPHLYAQHNDDVDVDEAWEHFMKSGFTQGRLVRMDNDCGAFVGSLDLKAYVERHGVDVSDVNQKPPFERELFGWRHYVNEGKEADLDIPITRVVPIFLLAKFDVARYVSKYPDVWRASRPARPGKFSVAGYLKLHPEAEEEGMSAFQHYTKNRQNEICVRGLVGPPNRRWYKKKYGKRFKHFFRRGFNEGLHIKVISESMSPLAHYCRYGHAEGRELWLLTAVGAFDGVLDKVAFMSVNSDAAESGKEPLEFLEEAGISGTKIPITRIKMRRVDAKHLESDRNFDDLGKVAWGEDSESDDDEDDDDDDDGGDDDDDDDGGDDDDDDDGGDDDDDEGDDD